MGEKRKIDEEENPSKKARIGGVENAIADTADEVRNILKHAEPSKEDDLLLLGDNEVLVIDGNESCDASLEEGELIGDSSDDELLLNVSPEEEQLVNVSRSKLFADAYVDELLADVYKETEPILELSAEEEYRLLAGLSDEEAKPVSAVEDDVIIRPKLADDRKIVKHGRNLRICVDRSGDDERWENDVAKTIMKDKLTWIKKKETLDVNQNTVLGVAENEPGDVPLEESNEKEMNWKWRSTITEDDLQELLDYVRKEEPEPDAPLTEVRIVSEEPKQFTLTSSRLLLGPPVAKVRIIPEEPKRFKLKDSQFGPAPAEMRIIPEEPKRFKLKDSQFGPAPAEMRIIPEEPKRFKLKDSQFGPAPAEMRIVSEELALDTSVPLPDSTSAEVIPEEPKTISLALDTSVPLPDSPSAEVRIVFEEPQAKRLALDTSVTLPDSPSAEVGIHSEEPKRLTTKVPEEIDLTASEENLRKKLISEIQAKNPVQTLPEKIKAHAQPVKPPEPITSKVTPEAAPKKPISFNRPAVVPKTQEQPQNVPAQTSTSNRPAVVPKTQEQPQNATPQTSTPNRPAVVPKTQEQPQNVPAQTSTSQKQSYAYISTDPRENSDNFHSDWDPLRNAATDEVRYRLIRERWRNLFVPDPSKNLSCRHGGLFAYPARKKQAQRAGRHRRTMSCSTAYETALIALKNDKSRRQHSLGCEQSYEINELSSRHQEHLRRLRNCYGLHSFPDVEFQQSRELACLFEKHAQEMRTVTRKEDDEIRKYTEYMMEVRSFHQFYQGLTINDHTDKTILTEEQTELKEEVEKMFDAYKRFY